MSLAMGSWQDRHPYGLSGAMEGDLYSSELDGLAKWRRVSPAAIIFDSARVSGSSVSSHSHWVCALEDCMILRSDTVLWSGPSIP